MSGQGLCIIKGQIDGKSDRQIAIYGAFIALASAFDVRGAQAVFSDQPLGTKLSAAEISGLIKEAHATQRDQSLLTLEEGLESFLGKTDALLVTVKSMEPRFLEQRINLFCMGEMNLRSVTFVEIDIANEQDEGFFPASREEPEPQDDEEKDEEQREGEFMVPCDLVLDPVHGVAVDSLTVGMSVLCRIPEASSCYMLFQSRFPDFDGVASGIIVEIKTLPSGMALLGVSLADGLTGVARLSKRVRIRRENVLLPATDPDAGGSFLRPLFAVFAVLLLMLVVAVFIYYFS